MVAFSDLTQVMQNARTDAKTLDEYVHGAADTQVTSRLGKRYWTLATLDNKLSLVKIKAEKTLADIDTLAVSANQSIGSKTTSANTTIDNKVASAITTIDSKVAAIDTRANAEINNLQSAINTAAAAGAGANGWTDLLVKLANGRTQSDKNQDFISTKDFGCVGDGVTDDSQNLAKAIKFAQENKRTLDGLGLTYACNNVLFDSNLQFINANLVCNKYDTDMISVLNSGESDEWLENVEFTNVKINGKRELHTNIKANSTSEDGGRHGFRIVRKTRNVKLTNCEAVNCAGDGIMLYPKSGAGNNRIVDVVLTDCNFSGNRRHGGSSDSVNGITFTRVKCNNNGLDIDANAAMNSGLRGDRSNGNLYGNGWDFEEYSLDYISTNIVLDDCEMVQNAKMGVLIYTRGNTSETAPKAIIKINGGSYDKGRFADTNIAIICRPSGSYTGTIKNTALFSVVGANLNGGEILCGYANNFTTRSLINFGTVNVIQNTIAYTDVPKSSTYTDPGSVINFDFKNQNGELNYSDGVMLVTPKTNNFYYKHDISSDGVVDFGLWYAGNNGGIRLKIDNFNATVSFTDFNRSEYITFNRTKIIPLRGNYTLGDATYRFETIYLNTAANVASDERIKKDIRLLTDAEKLVAKDLKAEICIYRLKDNDSKLQIGVIAQKVVSIFDKHGLNALDYQVVHYNADIDRYSIVYEQLILFVLSAI